MWRIEDFIPTYPDINNKDFYQTIFNKKEFNILSKDKYAKDIYFSHQRFIKRFISPYTPYDSILLFHGVGTGKSCSAIVVSEAHKIKKHCIVLVKNNTVKENFLQQLYSVCTVNEYNPTLKESKIRKLTKIYKKQGKSQEEIDNLIKDVKLSNREFVIRRNKKISKYYTVEKFKTFANILQKQSDSEIIIRYSNTIIIVDEVQNLKHEEEEIEKGVETVKFKKETLHSYDVIYKFLHLVKNVKILLLSATPMVNDVNEIASIFNLILPLDNQMPTEEDFNTKFISEDGTVPEGLGETVSKGLGGAVPKRLGGKQGKIINKDELLAFFKGRISYIRKAKEMPLKIDEGKVVSPLKYFKIVPCYISNFQKEVYEDIKEKGYYVKKSQALNFIFPDKTFSSKGFTTNIRVIDKRYSFVPKIVKSVKDNLKNLSCKYTKCLEIILANPKKLCLVFNKFVEGTGLIVFGLILELYGFKKYIFGTELKLETSFKAIERAEIKRYAIITGKTTKEETEKILEIYNSKDNRYGNKIQVLLISKVLSEARTLKNVRQVHILSPHWNIAVIDQIVGRGYRAFSHKDLNLEERTVEVYKYAAITKDINTSDILLYKKSEEKDILIKQVERLLKEADVNCSIFYDDNILIAKDFTRECDYDKCVYRCKDIVPIGDRQLNDESVPIYKPSIIIDDSYYSYYYREELEHVKNILLKVLPKLEIVNIFDLFSILPDYDTKIITLTLNDIIINNVKLIDNYGYICYLRLREIDSLLFLVKDIYDEKFSDSLYFYDRVLQYQPRLSFIEAMYINIIEKDMKIIKDIKGKDLKSLIDDIKKLSRNTQRILLERILGKVFRKEETTDKDKAILETYKDFIDYEHEKHNFSGIRCFKKNIFIDCPKPKVTKIGEKVTEEEKNIIDNKYGIYGIFVGDKFEIATRYKEKEALLKVPKGLAKVTDKRKVYSGKYCTSFIKPDLIEIANILGIKSLDDEKLEEAKKINKNTLIKEIKKIREFSSYTIEELESKDKKELDYIYSFKKIKKSFICDILKNWLVENKLVLRL